MVLQTPIHYMLTSFCSGENSSLDIRCLGGNNWNSLYVNGKFKL